MNEQHIIENLDGRPFAEFSEKELLQIQMHTAQCDACRLAFRSAQRTGAVLRVEASRAFEPSPFFQAKVLAALKKKSSALQPAWDLWKMWRASGALVPVMVAIVAALFFVGTIAPSTTDSAGSMGASSDTAEAVIFEQDNTLKDLASEQIFQEIYER